MSQDYDTHVNQEYVIRGNDVLMKCGVPSFVADFVTVLGWTDSQGQRIDANHNGSYLFSVLYQDFKAHVATESYVILGNDAILKCEIPSFVADLVGVASWRDSEGNEFAFGSQSQGKGLNLRPFSM